MRDVNFAKSSSVNSIEFECDYWTFWIHKNAFERILRLENYQSRFFTGMITDGSDYPIYSDVHGIQIYVLTVLVLKKRWCDVVLLFPCRMSKVIEILQLCFSIIISWKIDVKSSDILGQVKYGHKRRIRDGCFLRWAKKMEIPPNNIRSWWYNWQYAKDF